MGKKGGISSSAPAKSKKEEIVPYVLILSGLPGSGKSTLSSALDKHGWVRINQDDLGTSDECKKQMAKALKHGYSVAIDRCNVHAKERKMWVNEAKRCLEGAEANFICVCLDIPIEICKQRARERVNHATLDGDRADQVIDEFAQNFKRPESWEGPYSKVFIATTEKEVADCLKELQSYPINKKKSKD